MNFDRLAVPALQGLRAYDPGHDLVAWRRRVGPSLVELGSNENPANSIAGVSIVRGPSVRAVAEGGTGGGGTPGGGGGDPGGEAGGGDAPAAISAVCPRNE